MLAYKSGHDIDHWCECLPLVLSFVPEDGRSSVSIVGPGRKGCIQSSVTGFSGGLILVGGAHNSQVNRILWTGLPFCTQRKHVKGGKGRQGREQASPTSLE